MTHRVLVTGATGFVGSELTHQLLDAGTPVRIMRRTHSKMDLLGFAASHVEQVEGDLLDPLSLRAALEGVDQVYHTAAFVGFGRRYRQILYQMNVEGTRNVVNASIEMGVERLVFTSSMAAFGRPENPEVLINEGLPWQESRFNSSYARSKHLAELEVYRGIGEGLNATIVNPALIFGVGRSGENTRQIVDSVRKRRSFAAPPGGTNVVDVKDVAKGHILAMERGASGERYFLGSENLLWKDIITILAEAFHVSPPKFVISGRVALISAALAEAIAFVTRTRPVVTRDTVRSATRFYKYDNRKAVEELGLSFRSFRETANRIAHELGVE